MLKRLQANEELEEAIKRFFDWLENIDDSLIDINTNLEKQNDILLELIEQKNETIDLRKNKK